MSKKNQKYAVSDMNGYVDAIVETTSEELETIKQEVLELVSKEQIVAIINEQCDEYDDQQRPIIDQDIHINIIESTLTIVQNIALSQLASEGILECAWDDNLNEMVFWLAEE